MRGFDVGDFYAALTNQFLLVGVLVTAGLTVAGLAGGLILGLAVALMRVRMIMLERERHTDWVRAELHDAANRE